MLSLEIYLIRHAESDSNIAQDRIVGRSNWIKLTPHGIKQAQALGDRFRKEGMVFDAIYSSPAVRAKQTAYHCFSPDSDLVKSVQLEDELLEISQGDWEGRLANEVYTKKVLAMLEEDNWNYAMGDEFKGETPCKAAKRFRGWLEKMVKKHARGKIIAFGHGMIMKYLFADLFDLNKRNSYKIPFGNTSITILKYDGGKPICVVRNDISHLKEADLTSVGWEHDDPSLE